MEGSTDSIMLHNAIKHTNTFQYMIGHETNKDSKAQRHDKILIDCLHMLKMCPFELRLLPLWHYLIKLLILRYPYVHLHSFSSLYMFSRCSHSCSALTLSDGVLSILTDSHSAPS